MDEEPTELGLEFGITSDGMKQHSSSDRYRGRKELFLAELVVAEREHRHYWMAMFSYKVNEMPLQEGHMFDLENLRTGPVSHCFMCEQLWSPDLGLYCPGDPSGRTVPTS
jgi:hypothetical protein